MSHRDLNRILGVVVGLGALTICILWGLVGWYFINYFLSGDQVVNEPAPFDLPSQAELDEMSNAEKASLEADLLAQAATRPDTVMDDPMPEMDEPIIITQGEFQGVDTNYQGTGTATIYQLPDESYLLRFEAFTSTNGPDLHVILSGHPNPTTQTELMAVHLDLGSLKGNKGAQNYPIQSYVDISEFESVVIYCQLFGVIFSTASLSHQ